MIESTEMDSSSDHLYPRSFKDWKKLLQDHDFRILDAAGQEYIDFCRIIRPVRRKLKSLIEMVLGKEIGVRNQKQISDSDEDSAEANANIFGLSLPEKLFYLLFVPLVFAAYPLEFGLYKLNYWDKANYACLLARKK